MSEFKEKGNLALKNKDYNQALDFYSQAINLEPNNHIHYSNRSLCYFNLSQFEKALEDAEKCIEINQNWGKGYQRRGQSEYRLNKIWDSFASYSFGSLLDQSNQTIKSELQEIFKVVKEKFSSSLVNLMSNQAVQRLMQDPSNLNDLINPTADKIFEKGRELPEFVEVISLVLSVDKERINKDIEHYFILKVKEECQIEKEEKEEKEGKGKVNEKLTKGEDAFHKANDLFVFEQYENALEQYDIAIICEHENIHYLLNRAACYLKLGDDVLALEDCNFAIKKGLKSSRVYYLKTLAYLSMNKKELAVEANKEGLSLYPNDESLVKLQKTLV